MQNYTVACEFLDAFLPPFSFSFRYLAELTPGVNIQIESGLWGYCLNNFRSMFVLKHLYFCIVSQSDHKVLEQIIPESVLVYFAYFYISQKRLQDLAKLDLTLMKSTVKRGTNPPHLLRLGSLVVKAFALNAEV